MARILIYSDVHGNLPAFEAMLKDAGPCDSYICLGDLVNYGPWSNECVDLALSLPAPVLLMGNHEEAFIAGSYPGDNILVQRFFAACIPSFARHAEISGFQQAYTLDAYECCHTIGSQYIYPDTQIKLDRNYMIGHSHHQFLYENNGYKLYNAGSVGQNRKYINIASYLIYDTDDDGRTEMHNVRYPVGQVISEMKDRMYPQECIEYYLKKELA